MEPGGIIEWGGIAIIAVLIFAETGALLGLVIPGGESLLFAAGLMTSTGTLKTPVITLLLLLIVCGLSGDITGFFIGKKLGRKLLEKEDTWYFKKKYLKMAQDYYNKHPRFALIFGKFFPVVRPFNPVVSGISGLEFIKFLLITIAAVIIYMSIFILGGYFLGDQFPEIKKYMGWIIPVTIVIALASVFLQVRKMNKTQ